MTNYEKIQIDEFKDHYFVLEGGMYTQVAFDKRTTAKELHNLFAGAPIAYFTMKQMHAHMQQIVSIVDGKMVDKKMTLDQAKHDMKELAETIELMQTSLLNALHILEVGKAQVTKEYRAELMMKNKR